jgi:hypothetical protein
VKLFFIAHYNFIDLGILTIGRFYNAFDSKYIWEIEIKFLFWSFILQLNKR